MANKAFEIQESTLRIGGVDLQAGTTGVVIPGVTQATNYFVEEVDETGEQTNTLNLPIVIDNVTHVAKVADAGANVSAYATYTVELDDEDYVDEIEVNTPGTYVGSEVDRNADFDMWGYTGSDAEGYLTNWVTGDWVQIPFRPKMRAGEVENVGGGADLEDIQVNRDDEDGKTELVLADKDFDIRTTRSNPGQDADIGIYAADDLWLEAAGDEVSITAANQVTIYSNNANSSHEWIFNTTGHLQFPDGSVQVTAYTGNTDNNIWIETFASDSPTTDFVQSATSVEYDADGNIFALFNHYEPGADSTYTSVAKLAPAGAVLWKVRLAAGVNTDGWGLAYYALDNFVYVAGQTTVVGSYNVPTLMKIQGNTGTVDWSKSYDFGNTASSVVVDVASDGHPVMVGYGYNGTDNFIHTTKVDYADGSVIWSEKADGQSDEEAYGMAVGSDGTIVTVGYMDQLGATNAIATLYADPVSNANWTGTNLGFSVTQGVYFEVSFTAGVPAFSNIQDTIGNRVVDDIIITCQGSTIGGVDGVDDMIVKVASVSTDSANRMVVIKYYSDGEPEWQRAIQFDAGFDCRGADADIDADGNIYVCGSYQYDVYPSTTSAMNIVKFNSSGVKQWSRRVVGDCDTFGTSIVVGDDGYLYLSGITLNNNTGDYIWVVAKYDTAGTVVWQRLIDNTTTWSFGGAFWFANAGGSNIAVRNGYVALAGAFGDPGTQPTAVVLQIDTAATPFSVGDWDIKGATFSGTLNGTASDITVVPAGKTLSSITPTAADQMFNADGSEFLTVTRYSAGNVSLGDLTVVGNMLIGTGDAYGGDGLNIAPGPGLAADMYFRIHGGDNPTHLHLSVGNTSVYDQYFGTDSKFLVLGLDGNISIGTNGNNWKFGTDGATTFPTLTVPISDNATPSGTGQTLKFSDTTQQAIIFGPASTADNISAERVIIQGAPGYEDTSGEGGDVYLWAGPGGSAGGNGGDIKVRAGQGNASGQGGYLNFQAGDSQSGQGGYINIESGEGATNQGGNIDITARNGGQLRLYTSQDGNITLNTNGGSNVWTLSPTGTTTLPGAVVKSTVIVSTPLLQGVMTNFVSGPNTDPGWVDGNYNVTWAGGGSATIVIAAQTLNTISNIVYGTNVWSLNDTVGSFDVGGLVPFVITVDGIDNRAPINLNKSINCIGAGTYTLADGVEGQIMYLVPDISEFTISDNVIVTVAHGRDQSTQMSDWDLYPFHYYVGAEQVLTSICTLIFTQGHWQQVGGAWN